tara:strand:- start:1251 stop:1391 length:141 start_codon:yes stop_codon:yes gene_type:complete
MLDIEGWIQYCENRGIKNRKYLLLNLYDTVNDDNEDEFEANSLYCS